jgi:hypothetical protein
MNSATILAKLEAAYEADCTDSAKAQELSENFPTLCEAIEEILDA